MTDHVYRAMFVTDADAPLAREAWGTLDPEYGKEFRIPLAASSDPAVITHWMSAGPVTTGAAYVLPLKTWDAEGQEQYYPGHPDKVAQQCRDAGMEVTDAQIDALWRAADVSEQPVTTAMGRLGLVFYAEPEPEPVDELAEPTT